MKQSNISVAIATVGGLGRVRGAPGTWGSAVGVLLGVLMVRLTHRSVSMTLLVASFACGTFICAHAEHALKRHDPPSVILDEMWGMWAVCEFLRWMTFSWRWLLIGFVLFRVFDIAKPAPLRRLERWPGGWGIMADDAGAAAYTIVILQFAHWYFGF